MPSTTIETFREPRFRIPRRAAALGTLTVAALALSACGDDGSSESGGSGGDTAASTDIQTELDISIDDVQLASEGTLSVCSDVPYPPFEYHDDAGNVVGFDMDIAQGLADAFGAELEVVQTGFEGIQSGVALNADSCDLAISGMSITEERAGNMLFSEPYLNDNLGLLASEESGVESVDDLDDSITVGVQADTTGATYATDQGYSTRDYPDSGLLIQGLESGQVEAAMGNISILGYQAGEDASVTFVEEIDTGEQLGIAAQEGDQQLIDAVDEVLAEMESSGYMDEVKTKWFESGETPEEGSEESADESAEESAGESEESTEDSSTEGDG